MRFPGLMLFVRVVGIGVEARVDVNRLIRTDVARLLREILEIRVAVFQIVDGVNPATAALLDGTAWLVFSGAALLGVTEPLGWCRRAEVRRAVAAAWSRRSAAKSARPRCKPAASGPRREATSAWTRSAEPAAATEATWTRGARRAILTRTRFADSQAASLEGLGVESLDDFFGGSPLDELDERESARPAGLAIDRHDDVGRFCDGREVGFEIRFGRTVRQVSDEQTDCQSFLVKSAGLCRRP